MYFYSTGGRPRPQQDKVKKTHNTPLHIKADRGSSQREIIFSWRGVLIPFLERSSHGMKEIQ